MDFLLSSPFVKWGVLAVALYYAYQTLALRLKIRVPGSSLTPDAIMAAFLWRFAGFSMVVYLAAMQSIPREYGEYALLEGGSRFQRFRRVTWPLLWPQTFTLVLLTTLGTLRIFDMVWIMTAGGPSHATETVATDVYVTAFRFLQVGYAQAMAMILLALILVLAAIEYRILDRKAESVSG